MPGSDLVVARTAYKSNSSKYTINGKQSNYKEVQTLLKGRGIDLDHNRFLILQVIARSTPIQSLSDASSYRAKSSRSHR